MKKILTYCSIIGLSVFGANGISGEYCAPCDTHCAKDSCCDDCCGNFYVFAFGGGELDTSAEGAFSTPTGAVIPLALNLDDGFSFGGGVGVRSDFLCGFRFEIEGSYGENEVSSIDVGTNNFIAQSGELKTRDIHVNFIKEFRNFGCFTPYAGVGIGYTNIDADNIVYNNNGVLLDDDDGAFSWRLIAGLEAHLNECSTIFFEYNYSEVGDIDLFRLAGGLTVPTNLTLDDISSHAIRAGLRVAF